MLTDNREDWENRPVKPALTPDEQALVRQRTAEAAEFRQLEVDVTHAKLLAAAPTLAPLIKAALTGGAK